MNDYLVKHLTGAIAARDQEVMNYQVDIANFRFVQRSISERYGKADDSPKKAAMMKFAQHMARLEAASEIEMEKASLIRGGLQAQLDEAKRA